MAAPGACRGARIDVRRASPIDQELNECARRPFPEDPNSNARMSLPRWMSRVRVPSPAPLLDFELSSSFCQVRLAAPGGLREPPKRVWPSALRSAALPQPLWVLMVAVVGGRSPVQRATIHDRHRLAMALQEHQVRPATQGYEKFRSRPQSSGSGALRLHKVTAAPCSRLTTWYGTVRWATTFDDVHIQPTSDGS